MRSILALACLMATPALAAGPDLAGPDTPITVPDAPEPAPQKGAFVFTLRGGVQVEPEYFGSDDYTTGPDLGFRFHHLSLPGSFSIGNPDPRADRMGFGVGGSLRIISERDPDDHADLAGMDKVDAALELGLSLRYGARNADAFVDLRRGFGGHEGYVAEAGANAIFRPSDRLRIAAGPRALFGNDTYTGTYFGVTPAEATGARPAYDPEGGLVSYGAEIEMRYALTDVWGLEGAVTYDRFADLAADSPIVAQGSDDQWAVRFGVTRAFSLGW